MNIQKEMLTGTVKELICRDILENILTVHAAVFHLPVSQKTIYEWKTIYKRQLENIEQVQGTDAWRDKRGVANLSPNMKPTVGPTGLRNANRALTTAWKDSNQEKNSKNISNKNDRPGKTDEMLKIVKITSLVNGNTAPITSVGKRTQEKILKQSNSKEVKGRKISKARVENVDSYRNATTMACFCEAKCKGKDPGLMGNTDPTLFCTLCDDHDCKVMYVGMDENSNPDLPSTAEARFISDNENALFIKVIPTVFADGNSAPLVYCCQDDRLDPNDFLALKVDGLSDNVRPGAFGYLIFTKTRAGNFESTKWIAMNCVLPYIRDIVTAKAKAHGMTVLEAVETGKFASIFTMDGEKVGMDAWNHQEVIDFMDKYDIELHKFAASCSLIQQALDMGPIFRNSKATLKTGINYMDHYQDDTLQLNIRKQLKTLEHRLTFTEGYLKKLVRGLLQVTFCLRRHMGVVNNKRGFEKSGMLAPADNWEFYGREIPFNHCTTKHTVAEKRVTWNAMPLLIARYIEEGELSDRFMDDNHIKRSESEIGVFKEDRVDNRQRNIHVNHKQTVARRKAWYDRRALAQEEERQKKDVSSTKKVGKTAIKALYAESKDKTASAKEHR